MASETDARVATQEVIWIIEGSDNSGADWFPHHLCMKMNTPEATEQRAREYADYLNGYYHSSRRYRARAYVGL